MWFELKLLIRYAWVIDPATGLNTMTNLLIEDGKIVKVGGGPMQADPRSSTRPGWWLPPA